MIDEDKHDDEEKGVSADAAEEMLDGEIDEEEDDASPLSEFGEEEHSDDRYE
jgi:hypothetical protein